MLKNPSLIEKLRRFPAKGYAKPYQRDGFFEVEEVHEQIGDQRVVWGDDPIKMDSDRYKVFRESRVCAGCGCEGVVYAKERTAKVNKTTGKVVPFTESWHFNLYGVDTKGKLVLMTKDHVVGKAAGGSNSLENYQCMCFPCNNKKGLKAQKENKRG